MAPSPPVADTSNRAEAGTGTGAAPPPDPDPHPPPADGADRVQEDRIPVMSTRPGSEPSKALNGASKTKAPAKS